MENIFSGHSSNKSGIIKIFLLCLAGFTLGRLFIFPGFLDPFVPSHSDLYRYFSLSQRIWLYTRWLSPRPLMILSLHVLGIFQSPSVIWFILSLTSVIFSAVLIFVLQQFGGLMPNLMSILLYSAIIFSLPTSFEIYQLDYGGMLAGILSLIAIYSWLYYRQTDTTKALWLSLVMFWLSLEMKPTFAVTIFLLAFLQFVFQKDKTTLFLLVAVLGISFFVILKDRFLGSPFLGSGNGVEIYAVQVDPRQNLRALWVYIKSAVTIELLPGLVIAYYLFWHTFHRSWAIIAILLTLAISPIILMSIIPNRTLELYAWYCGMLLCIPFLYIFQTKIAVQPDPPTLSARTRKALVSITLLTTLIALIASPKLHALQAQYDFFISSYNRNMIGSLERLNDLNIEHDLILSRGILISGVKGPYHPFRNQSYILDRTHIPNSYVLLLRKSETAWDDSAHDMGTTLYSDQLDIQAFDFFVIYARDGNLSRILTREEMESVPEWRQIPTLACNLNPFLQTWTVKILENTVSCLDEAGESTAVLELMDHVGNVEMTPVLHYYLGHAYELIGDLPSARMEYEAALEVGENEYFRNALDSLPNK